MSQPNPSYQKARVFYEQKRYAEAEKYFYEALSVSPQDTVILYELAFSQYMQKGREEAGLKTIQNALSIEPNKGYIHLLTTLILAALGRAKEALESAQRAVELEPEESLSFAALAASYLSAEEWQKAEEAARKALSLDPDCSTAETYLIHALRMQGKKEEAKRLVGQSLAKDPEGVYTRSNAGWAALQRGEANEAREHFLETLRLDPQNQYVTSARDGFLETVKTNSFLYRTHLKFSFWLSRLSQGQRRWLFILFPIILIKLGPLLSVNRWALGLAIACIGIYWLVFLWRHLAESIGNLILLKDPLARNILNQAEKRTAYLTGIGLLLGPVLIGLGIGLHKDSLIVSGAWLAGSVIPLNYFSSSEFKIEKTFLMIISIFYLLVIVLYLTKTFYSSNLIKAQLIFLILIVFILPAIWSWVRLIFFRSKN